MTAVLSSHVKLWIMAELKMDYSQLVAVVIWTNPVDP